MDLWIGKDMKKRIISILFAVLLILTTGCDVMKFITLPENPLVFSKTGVKADNNVTYDAIQIDDKLYVVYAEFSDYYSPFVDKCIGYVDTGSKTPELYVCTIVDLSGDEYLMTVNAMTHGIPSIYREISVQGELEYKGIEPCGYPVWDK